MMNRALLLGVLTLGLVAGATVTCTSILSLEPATLLEGGAPAPVRTCPTGFESCGGTLCDTNVQTSMTNCGACGVTCGGAGAAATCVAGACQLTCQTGVADCNQSPADGCESNLVSDPKNCGACGHDCLGGACINQVCQPFLLGVAEANVNRLSISGGDAIYSSGANLVSAIPLAGGQPRRIIDRTAPFPVRDLTRSGDGAFFITTYPTSKIYRASANLESLDCVGKASSGPSNVQSDGKYAYWIDARVPPSPNANYQIYVARSPLDAGCGTADGGTTGTPLWQFPPDAAAPQIFASTVGVQGGLVYAIASDNKTGKRTLVQVAPDGSFTTIADAASMGDFRVVGDTLYYVVNGNGISSQPLAGCPDSGPCATSIFTGPVSTFEVGDFVYVVSGTHPGFQYGSLYSLCRQPKGGGACAFTYSETSQDYNLAVTLALSAERVVFGFGRNVYSLAR